MKLPEGQWWEVFDVEREELGFLVVGIRSLESWVRGKQLGVGREGRFLERRDIMEELGKRGLASGTAEDEEDEMMRLLDEKVAA